MIDHTPTFTPCRSGRCPIQKRVGTDILAVSILTAILWGVLYFLTPNLVEGLSFVGSYRACNGMSDSPSLSALWKFICDIREGDTARVSNVLSIPFMLWSPWKWIFPWLSGLLTSLMIWMGARYAFGRALDWTSYAVVWFLVDFFLPWRNLLLTPVYCLNYLYPAVLTLFLVRYIMLTNRWNLRFWLGIPLVMLAGWWHEGFAATALCGLGFVMLLRRGRMPLQWWILCVIYGLTVILLVSAPHVMGRIADETSTTGRWFHPGLVVDAFMVFCLLLSMGCALFFKTGRRHLATLFRGWQFPLFFTIAVTGISLAFLFVYTPRVCFWPSLAAIIALGLLWRPLWTRSGSWFRFSAGLIAIIVCTLQLIVAIEWQAKFYNQYEEANVLLDASPTGTIFYDVIPTSALPKTTLYYPTKEIWASDLNLWALSFAKGDRQIAVVPRSLRDARPGDSSALSGNVPVYTAGNALFIDPRNVPALRLPPDIVRYINVVADCSLTFDDGTTIAPTPAMLIYYVNAPGDTLLYLYPCEIDIDRADRVREVNVPLDNIIVHEIRTH